MYAILFATDINVASKKSQRRDFHHKKKKDISIQNNIIFLILLSNCYLIYYPLDGNLENSWVVDRKEGLFCTEKVANLHILGQGRGVRSS